MKKSPRLCQCLHFTGFWQLLCQMWGPNPSGNTFLSSVIKILLGWAFQIHFQHWFTFIATSRSSHTHTNPQSPTHTSPCSDSTPDWIGLIDLQSSLYGLITTPIFPTIAPALIHTRAVKFCFPQFPVHFIMKKTQPLGEVSSVASIRLICT